MKRRRVRNYCHRAHALIRKGRHRAAFFKHRRKSKLQQRRDRLYQLRMKKRYSGRAYNKKYHRRSSIWKKGWARIHTAAYLRRHSRAKNRGDALRAKLIKKYGKREGSKRYSQLLTFLLDNLGTPASRRYSRIQHRRGKWGWRKKRGVKR